MLCGEPRSTAYTIVRINLLRALIQASPAYAPANTKLQPQPFHSFSFSFSSTSGYLSHSSALSSNVPSANVRRVVFSLPRGMLMHSEILALTLQHARESSVLILSFDSIYENPSLLYFCFFAVVVVVVLVVRVTLIQHRRRFFSAHRLPFPRPTPIVDENGSQPFSLSLKLPQQ